MSPFRTVDVILYHFQINIIQWRFLVSAYLRWNGLANYKQKFPNDLKCLFFSLFIAFGVETISWPSLICFGGSFGLGQIRNIPVFLSSLWFESSAFPVQLWIGFFKTST